MLRCLAVGLILLAALLNAQRLPLPYKDRGSANQGRGSPASLNPAINLAAMYLESACGESGRFAYRLDPGSGQLSSSYNIVRHAGAIYALAMFNRSHPDRAAVDAFTRSDPYHVNGVWERVEINRYNKKRGTAIASKR